MDHVRVREDELVRVLDDDETLPGRYLRRERSQERALPDTGGTDDEDVRPGDDGVDEQVGRRGRDRTRGGPGRRGAAQGQGRATEGADGDRRPADRCDHRVRPAPVAHSRVDERALQRELATDARGDAMRELGDACRVFEADVGPLQQAVAFDEDLVGRVDQHVGHLRIVEQRLEDPEAEELRGERIDLRLGEVRVRRAPHAFVQRATPRRVRVDHEHRPRIQTRGDFGADPRHALVARHSARMSRSTARIVVARTAKSSRAR